MLICNGGQAMALGHALVAPRTSCMAALAAAPRWDALCRAAHTKVELAHVEVELLLAIGRLCPDSRHCQCLHDHVLAQRLLRHVAIWPSAKLSERSAPVRFVLRTPQNV